MTEARPRADCLERRECYRMIAIVAGVLGLVAAGSSHAVGTELLPVPGVLGLAARDESDRTTVERLANEVEAYVDRLDITDRGTDPVTEVPVGPELGPEAEPESESESEPESEPAAQDPDSRRNDEVERLAAAVDDLTSAVERRERHLAESERYRTELYRITSDPSASGDEKIRRVLELGCERLGVEAGFVSRIDPERERYTVQFARGSDLVQEAEESDLSTMYCRHAIDADGILEIYNAPAEGYEDEPSYAELDVGCYLGGRIEVDGDLYGTLCFVAREPRTEPFTGPERTFVDLATRWVSHELDRRTYERELERQRTFTDDLLDALDDVFYVVDEDRSLRRWNDALTDVTGYSHAELEAMDEPLYFDADARTAIEESVAEVFETGETRVEAPLTTKDGERIPHEFVASVIEDPDGNQIEVGIARDISDRKRYERELERTTHLLEQAQRLTSVGAWELDVRGASPDVQWTDETARIHGVDPDTDPGIEDALEYYHPADRPRLREAIDRALERGESYELELRMRTATDDRQWVRTIGEPIYDDGTAADSETEIVGVRGSIQEITARKERERELRETNERLNAIIEASPAALVALDRDENVTLWNPAAERIFGWSESDVLDDPLPIVPDDRDDHQPIFERVLEGETIAGLETKRRREDGSLIDVSVSAAPIRDADGEIVGTMGALEDITERKERERRLETTTARLEALFDDSPDIINVVDADGTIVEANRRFADELGYAEGELLGTKVWKYDELFDADDALGLLEGMAVGERRKFEGRFRRRDGSTFPIEVHLIRLDLEDENRFLAICRDITERKLREQDLQETKRRLELALEGTNTGLWEWNVDTDEIDWSGTLERLVGLEPGAFEGTYEAFERRVHPDDVDRVEAALEAAVEERELYRTEFRMRREDGDWIWIGARGRLVTDADGGRRMVGILNDVTERVEYERELERTTNLLERVQRMADIGGWELDVTDEPQVAIWSDELYRLHDLSRDVEPDLETTIECYHPDDRPLVREELERALETETEYELEARIRTDSGENKWVRAIGEPIHEGGDLVAYRGALQDITAQKERERTLESLTETARRLLNATTEPAVAELAAETATELLEGASAGVYLLDAETNRFEPVASAGDFEERTGGAPSVAVGGDSLLWNTYVTGTQTVVDGGSGASGTPLFGDDASSGLLVPLGEHGAFVLLAPPAAIDDETRRLFETLVATVEAAFDRLESEASLRERDAELEARNRRLRRQISITDLIRRIDRSLIGAESRDEIERTVPERLVEADDIAFAWIGAADPGETTLEPRTWAGTSPEYLDAVSLDLSSGTEPAVRTARTETPTVVENVVDDLQEGAWRTTALNEGLQSAVAVPLEFEEYGYGVLAVYADEPDAFTDLERTVFAELGEGIANAINAVQTREALHAESVVELTLEFSDADDVLSRIAEGADARVAYEGLSTSSEEEALLFFEIEGAETDDAADTGDAEDGASAARDVLEDLVAVTDYRVIAATDDGWLVEATVAGDVLASRLVRHGASPRSIAADGDRTVVTADVPPGTDVREFVEMLADRYPSVDLRSRRHVQRDTHTRRELVASLLDPLTERQLEVLRTAYFAGFFEWPRESTGEEVAELLEVTQPTVNRHLRLAQQRLLSQLFETETRPFGGET
ncbi:PAS domain S-box protein [Halopiger xanaduensis]|uniref:histidine kinase n=1 Tax=Halopiger xanaduensis (strain DSM 18323 / JCM 14033 / SH-6) TaxID=797210 RepID=F8DBC4_HALXS|nr:PAS domain S-box protein [Halopiger xanaduensis]AEH35903.1 putative PAS/PAC sensor protein [Halopiger xanaduensis SH-6]